MNNNTHAYKPAAIVATYTYHQADGTPAYRVNRYDPKDFRQQHYDRGQWLNGLGTHKDKPLPYRLPELTEAIQSGSATPIYITEGEKHADALHKLGLTSTTNNGGAGHWTATQSAYLKGAHVALLPDNDVPGRDHMAKVARYLHDTQVASIRVIVLPDLPAKGDVLNWLSAGGSVAQLQAFYDTAPIYQPGDLDKWLIKLPKAATPAVKAPIRRFEGDISRYASWAHAALDGVVNDLAATPTGRYSALKAAANRLGTIAARGLLSETECITALLSACDTNGYSAEKGNRKAEYDARFYFQSGLGHLCDLPEDKPLPELIHAAPKYNPKRIDLPDMPSAVKQSEPTPLTVSEARSALAAKLKTIIQADDTTGKATILDVPCGVGKTRALLTAISQAINANPDLKVAYLNINRYDQRDGEQWLKEHGVPDLAKSAFWFRGRSDKPDRTNSGDYGSAYCKQPDEVIRVSQAGHDPHDLVCLHCDLYSRCEEKHYLSQVKLAKQKQLLIARHTHIRHAELLENRTLIIIDENITPVLLTEKIVFSIATLRRVDTFTIRTIPGDPEEEYLIKRSVTANAAMFAIGSVIAAALDSLPAPTNYPNPIDNVKLGGKWLFDRLTKAIGLESVKQQLTTLTDFVETENDRKQLLDVTDGQPLPGNVETLIEWLSKEITLYVQGKPFNSRLIPERLSSDPGQLVLYPMEQISVGSSARVIVADASPNYALYEAAFDAPIVPYKLNIEQRAIVTHITGSLNTRLALKLNQLPAPKKADPMIITTLDGDTIETPTMPSNTATDYLTDVKALERVKDLITHVVKSHGTSKVAIVSYKALIEKHLRPWAAAAFGIAASNCFWFGGNRGKNAYAHLEAIVSIGTPFKPDYDVLRSAQLWLCNDAQAIDSTRQRYRLPHTDGILSGYADPRVQAMFFHEVTAELMQSAERVRLNTSIGKRYLYALTDVPFIDKIDLVTTFERYTVQLKIRQLTLDLPDPIVTRQQIVDQLVSEKVASDRTIRDETAAVWQTMQDEGLGEIEMTFRKAGKGKPGAAFSKERPEL